MAIEKAQAIILGKSNLRETSLIVSFFSREFGKLKGLLKAARSDYGKFGSSLELFSINEIVFYRKVQGEVHLVSHCDLLSNFNNLRQDLDKLHMAGYFSKLIDVVMAAEDSNKEVYELLFNSLKTLDQGHDLEFLKKLFEIKILSLSGFKPYLDSCISCGDKILNNSRFSSKMGGLICQECIFKDEAANLISQGAIQSLLHLERTPWTDSLRLKLNKNLDNELSFILKEFLTFHTGINLMLPNAI